MAGETSKIKLPEEKLIFIQHSLPTMQAGEYEFSAMVKGVKDKEGKDVSGDFEKTKEIVYVDAPRFTLDVGGIYTVYPPDGHFGHVARSLPHIVLNRRTLPWERTLDGKLAGADPKPWMALLLLSEKEINANAEKPIKIINGSLSDLEVKEDFIKGPALKMNPWEKSDQPCQYIDIPGQLFKEISPTLEDLPFLAHVKKVSVDKHKEAASIDDDGFFSTLICNRLPSEPSDEDLHHTVFLVSLEGHKETIKNKGTLKDGSYVRLITFYQWSFTQAEGKDFQQLCEDLTINQLKYHPDLPDDQDPETFGRQRDALKAFNQNPSLQKAIEFGYVPLPQNARNGMKTFAWYRGPLSPNFIPTDPQTRIFNSADSALRFDKATGLFDASYASAWQLGRLLALKDNVFTNELFSWKNKYKTLENTSSTLNTVRNTLPGMDKAQWEKLLPQTKKADDNEPFIFEDLVQAFLTEKFNPGEHRMTAVTKKETTETEKLNPGRPPIPKTLKTWLEDKLLLYDVPFNYLVPNEKMLKEESLANFHMDYAWIKCMLDGALSLARTSDSENLMNEVMKKGALSRINELKDQMVAELQDIKDNGKKIITPSLNGFISGFMLRSKLISGWPGVKVFAKGVDTDTSLEKPSDWLVHLRLERIKDDILFCLFDRKVRQVVIMQPPESLHFGLGGGNKLTKTLRVWQPGPNLGKVDPARKVEDIPFREPGLKVLNIEQLAKKMKTNSGQATFTSAHFAFHMVESPVLFTLEINY